MHLSHPPTKTFLSRFFIHLRQRLITCPFIWPRLADILPINSAAASSYARAAISAVGNIPSHLLNYFQTWIPYLRRPFTWWLLPYSFVFLVLFCLFVPLLESAAAATSDAAERTGTSIRKGKISSAGDLVWWWRVPPDVRYHLSNTKRKKKEVVVQQGFDHQRERCMNNPFFL